MIATRFNPLGKRLGKLTAKDYIQDGLIHQWDGIENVGFGVHDSTSSIWKDLVGGLDLDLTEDTTWSDISMRTKTSNPTRAFKSVGTTMNPNGKTIEVCMRIDTIPTSNSLIGSALSSGANPTIYSSRLAVCVKSSTGQLVFGLQPASGSPNIAHSSSNVPSSVVGIPFTASKYANASSLTGTAFYNGKRIELDIPLAGECTKQMNTMQIGTMWASRANGHFCSTRIYNRELTDAEAEWNDYVERERFCALFNGDI